MNRTFVFEAGQPCRLSSSKCMRHGPSNLGECLLVRGCSEGTFLGLVGMDCYSLGPENFVSGIILVQKVTIFTLQSVFQTLKI